MSENPKREPVAPSSDLRIVVESIAKNAIKAMPTYGGFLADMLQARKDQLAKAMRDQNEERLNKLYEEMLSSAAFMDERSASAFLDSSDFHALARACVADIEDEKAAAYGALARGIASGAVRMENRRHFILSLRDLSLDELVRLRKAHMAHEHELMPDQGGSGQIAEAEFVNSSRPGSLESVYSNNLKACGFVHDGRLTSLGVEFTKTIWKPFELTPESLNFRKWSEHNVAIMSYEIGRPACDRLATELADRLRAAGCRSNVLAPLAGRVDEIRRSATLGVLILGKESRLKAMSTEGELRQLLTKLPTVIVYASPDSEGPNQLQVLRVVRYDGDLPGFFVPIVPRKSAPRLRGDHAKRSIHRRADGRDPARG